MGTNKAKGVAGKASFRNGTGTWVSKEDLAVFRRRRGKGTEEALVTHPSAPSGPGSQWDTSRGSRREPGGHGGGMLSRCSQRPPRAAEGLCHVATGRAVREKRPLSPASGVGAAWVTAQDDTQTGRPREQPELATGGAVLKRCGQACRPWR